MNCQKCDFQNEEAAKYCRNCGMKLIIPQPQPAIAMKICPKCNFQNANNILFCGNCGTELENGKNKIKQNLPDITSAKSARLWKTIAILFPAIMLVFSLIVLSDVKKVLGISNVEKLVEKNVYGTDTSYFADGRPFSSFLGAEAWANSWRFSVSSSESLEDIAAKGLKNAVWQTDEDTMWVMLASSIQLGIVLLCLFVIWLQRKKHT
jgi:hypothetical protein